MRCRSIIAYLWLVSQSVITAATVVSLPVPAVVGIAMRGGMGRPTFKSPASCVSFLLGLAHSAAAAFAASIGEPPPRAMKPSQPFSL